MGKPDIKESQAQLQEAFATFEREHPEVAEAMKVMSMSFPDYLEALASLKDTSSSSGSAATAS